MKRIFFLDAILLLLYFSITPIFAEDQPSSQVQQSPVVLKFQVTSLENIIDAKGSNLMNNFEEAVENEVKILQRKKNKYIKILENHETKFQQDATLSPSERYVIETDVISLKRKIKIVEDNVIKVTEKEKFLQQILRQILKKDKNGGTISFSVVNWKFLSITNIRNLSKINFSPMYGGSDEKLMITYNIPSVDSETNNKIWHIYGINTLFCLGDIQKEMQKLARFVRNFDESSSTVSLANDLEKLNIEQVALKTGKSSADRIRQEIERLEEKARTVIIPSFASNYWMAEIITAFNNEVQFHKPNINKEVGANAQNDDE